MTNRKALILLAAFGTVSGIVSWNIFKSSETKKPSSSAEMISTPKAVKEQKQTEVFSSPTTPIEPHSVTVKPTQLNPAIKNEGMLQQTRNIVELSDLINVERVKKGVRVLRITTSLSDAAQVHAEYLLSEQRCSHRGLDDLLPWQRARADGEVVGCGYSTAKDVLMAWWTSKANHDFILRPDIKRFGIGYSDQYWVVLFGL